jgi:pyruvate kinase
LKRVSEGDILVTYATDKDLMPAVERAAAIITEEGGLTSHAAVVGVTLGKPVIVGAEGAVEKVEDGLLITVDPQRGLVYRGRAQVL